MALHDSTVDRFMACGVAGLSVIADSLSAIKYAEVTPIIGENGVGLSEGQIQRLTIARSILIDAPIMLLDEATSALDEITEKKVLNNLKTLSGATLVIISHKPAALAICNKVVEIKDKSINVLK
jgi:ATP-binding cassette subfamily B protein